MWPRDSYTGPGGGLYTGPGGGLYAGPGGGAYAGPGGGLYRGPGGGLYKGPGGGLYAGPGGGLYRGPGGGLYTGPGGGLYRGPGGGLYAGTGGGLYTGPSHAPYRRNWPTRQVLIEELERLGHDRDRRRSSRRMAPLAVANHDTTHDEVHEHVPGNVAIPRTPELLLPMLRAAHDLGGSATRAELLDHVRGVAELTDEQIAVVYAGASGKSKVLHRAEWGDLLAQSDRRA